MGNRQASLRTEFTERKKNPVYFAPNTIIHYHVTGPNLTSLWYEGEVIAHDTTSGRLVFRDRHGRVDWLDNDCDPLESNVRLPDRAPDANG